MTREQAVEAYRCLVELWYHQRGYKVTDIVIEPRTPEDKNE